MTALLFLTSSLIITTLPANATPTAWTKIISSGFGDPNNQQMEFMAVLNDYIYVGTGNWATGGEVWRSSDGKTFAKVADTGFGNPNNVEVFFFPGAILNGYLYAGTGNDAQGGEVYRSSDGIHWTWIFDVPSWDDIDVFPTLVFENYLYVGSYNTHAGGRIWRSSNGINWTQINTDGFGDPNNFMAFPATVFNGYLYTGTRNEVTGGEVWRTENGLDWTQVNVDGFSNASNIWSFVGPVFEGSLYVGTANEVFGGTILVLSAVCGNWANAAGMSQGFGTIANVKAMPAVVFNCCLYAGTYNTITGGEIWLLQQHVVGGIVASVDKSVLLIPYMGISSAILLVTIVAAVCIKREKCRKEKP